MAETKPTRILIIDDDPGIRKTLADILRAKGYETLSAKDGLEGLALLREEPFDLVLIDLKLPDISGLEVLEKVRVGCPSTEAIILTGNATLDSAIEATNQGAFSYLQKPYDMEQLLLFIRRAVEKQQADEEIARLASFPRLNPDPVIEIGAGGGITYMNPAAEWLFPDLRTLGSRHPIIAGVKEMFPALQKSEDRQSLREVEFGDFVYEEHVYIPENGFIRVYAVDATERKRAEKALRREFDEVERLNKLMVGRELKMEEMREKIKEMESRIESLTKQGTREGR